MATLVVQPESITEQFGPHLSKSTGMRLDPGVVPDKVVETHCCFCGQQCGIQLLVKDNQVIGYEPWYEFPFNKGKLCPKGVKRYLQGAHPDRLLHAYKRDSGNPHGFSPIPYEEAIRKVAEEIDRIQKTYGPSAFASLSGASLTTEKCYLMGKFARVCLKTPYTDYNGRLCMVSAGAGNKKAFGIDRAANPWNDILKAEVVWISGANVAECAPITTDYVWQARENGGKVIVVDPRITPIGRTCDLLLPIKPGRDVALFNGILHLMIKNDWIDHSFIENYTVGFDEVAASVEEWTPERTAKITGIAEKGILQAAEWWGTAKTSFLMHARGIEHSSHGVQNVLGAINIVLASGRIGRESCGYGTITGQGNGQGGREHGQKCDQLPGMRDISNPEHRAYVASVWGVDPNELPGAGVDAYEIFRKIDRGEIRGLLSISFNPIVSLPDNNFVRRALEKLEFYVAVDFFLNDTARYALNGSWLLLTVATESLTVLGTLVAQTLGPVRPILFGALCAYLLGAMFYILFIALIIYRWIFISMEPAKLTPPYWINMGALAITTLAGARLILSSKSWEILHDFRPFIGGFTLFFWATGTWWIPLLVIVGFWRHVIERVPLTYDPQYWSLVFPLGMYTVATFMFANATGMQFLLIIPHIFVYIAMLVWLITFSAMILKIGRFCFAFGRQKLRPRPEHIG